MSGLLIPFIQDNLVWLLALVGLCVVAVMVLKTVIKLAVSAIVLFFIVTLYTGYSPDLGSLGDKALASYDDSKDKVVIEKFTDAGEKVEYKPIGKGFSLSGDGFKVVGNFDNDNVSVTVGNRTHVYDFTDAMKRYTRQLIDTKVQNASP